MPTTTVNIPKTTFVSSAQPGNNLSFYPVMYAGTDSNLLNCISLLQITLPQLPVNQVDSASLQLVVIVKSGTAPSPIVVNQVTDSFDTSTVTYDTRPPFTATTTSINVNSSDLYSTVKFDVTALVNSWLNGTAQNNGIALTNSDGSTAVQFATNAISYEPYFPKLVLTYSSSPGDNTAICFSYAQTANLLTQIIRNYPSETITVHTKSFNAVTIKGTPVKLYASPDATYGTLFVLEDSGQYAAVPLTAIASISLPAGAVYDASITYLSAPAFPAGCDKNLITAYHSYLSTTTSATIYSGILIESTGLVFKNEYGIIVLADDMQGTNPVFIPVTNITGIVTSALPSRSMDKTNPQLVIPGKI